MNTKIDTQHWNRYYKRHFIEEASPFAQFCQEDFLMEPKRMVEFGSGSGRDLRYLHHAGHRITGYDTSEEAVHHIQSAYPDLDIVLADFSSLDAIPGLEAVYSRWTMHSIDEEAAACALRWCGTHLLDAGMLLIEVRTINDHLYGEGEPAGRHAFVTDHYRRFIVPEEMRERLEQLNFKVLYFEEGQGFSVYKGEDPVLLRVVAEKTSG